MSRRTRERDRRRRSLWQPREAEARREPRLAPAVEFDKARRNICHLATRRQAPRWTELEQVLRTFVSEKLGRADAVRRPGTPEGVCRQFDTARRWIARIDDEHDRVQRWLGLETAIREFNLQFDVTRRRRVDAA